MASENAQLQKDQVSCTTILFHVSPYAEMFVHTSILFQDLVYQQDHTQAILGMSHSLQEPLMLSLVYKTFCFYRWTRKSNTEHNLQQLNQ